MKNHLPFFYGFEALIRCYSRLL